MKVIFMGTPDFAVGTLEALHEAGHEITLVVSQPDKPKGRGHALQPTPVKAAAEHLGLPVFQPAKVREAADMLEQTPADVIVVAAFGQLIPSRILHMKKFGCVNVHASLLPKYRGAAPIQWAVIDGEKESGATIMQMDEGLDTGDVLYCKKITIDPEETSGELFDRVTAVGAEALCETIPQIAAGTLTAVPQDHENATPCPHAEQGDGGVPPDRHCRPYPQLGARHEPLAHGLVRDRRRQKVKVTECRVAASNGEAPGTVLSTKPLTVACADGAVQLLHVVPEGKKPMDGTSFAAGLRLKAGDTL